MDKVIEQIAIKHLREAYPLVSEEKFIELYAENNPVHKAYLNAMLEVSQLSPATPATSWEQMEEEARNWAHKQMKENMSYIIDNKGKEYRHHHRRYMLEYFAQHWPVSPTPMAETWEEVFKSAFEHAQQDAPMVGYMQALHDWLTKYNTYISFHAPSLHQVDRWVEISEILSNYNPSDSPTENTHLQEIIQRFIDSRIKQNYHLIKK